MNRSELPADLEAFVERELAEGKYRSEGELVADALRILRERHSYREGHPENGTLHVPMWEIFQETLKDIPAQKLDHLPPDAAEQHDHYLYGTPKKPAWGISLPICYSRSRSLAPETAGIARPSTSVEASESTASGLRMKS
jgi:Arc/MetJ-type ribon-helix-helix transcriptional regulator